MDDATAKLGLPYLLPAQAQKHVTHNEALTILDLLVQLRIEFEAISPPETSAAGQCYAVAENAQGAWSGYDGHIAEWQDGVWSFLEPKEGFVAWFLADARLKVYRNDRWLDVPSPDQIETGRLGVNATPDDYNRVSISAPAILFNHAGASQQVKINKASASETASLLFQSNWSGRAEMGLAGSDDFSLKVCGEDGDWKTALHINGNGTATYPNRPIALAYRNTATSTPASGSQSGFSALDIQQGGLELGPTLSAGGQVIVIRDAGIYCLSLTVAASATAPSSIGILRNDTDNLLLLKMPVSASQTVSGSTIANLAAGDWLSLAHSGSMTIEEGRAFSALSLFRL